VELAELICARSTELSDAERASDVQRAALSLSGIAGHNTGVLRHAATIFRTRLRRDPDDAAANDGLRLLTKVLALLN